MRTVVHEMRNQLAVAVANIEAFIDGKLEPSPSRLKAVLQALNELDILINDLRGQSASSPMRSEPRVMDICTVITNEGLAIEAAAKGKGLAFAVHQCPRAHPACLTFSGDPVRIGQVVMNLLINAVRYTPAGGSIWVDCRREPGRLSFTVANDGPGIAPEHLPHIFEPGYRGSPATHASGTGMGLAVAKQFVEDHGGTIDVQSSPGHGAAFTVRLPDPTPVASCANCSDLRVLGPQPVA